MIKIIQRRPDMQNITLNDGTVIPQVGLGVFRARDGEQTEQSVLWALEAGYRHIDTAKAYRNEASVGRAIKKSGISREEIYITTKVWNEDVRQGTTRRACLESLQKLGTDYIDLYLIHWPAEGYELAWKEMERLREEGYVRSIGVSNFHMHHIDTMMIKGKILPSVDQIEAHPYFTNQKLIDDLKERGIAVEVWSPLAGGNHAAELLAEPVLQEIGAKYGKTSAQVVLRWHLQRDTIVIPKSVHQERIVENFDLFDFELSDEEMQQISALNRNTRVGADPETFDF